MLETEVNCTTQKQEATLNVTGNSWQVHDAPHRLQRESRLADKVDYPAYGGTNAPATTANGTSVRAMHLLHSSAIVRTRPVSFSHFSSCKNHKICECIVQCCFSFGMCHTCFLLLFCPQMGDKTLAQSAQMFHYQHQKQQMLSMGKYDDFSCFFTFSATPFFLSDVKVEFSTTSSDIVTTLPNFFFFFFF